MRLPFPFALRVGTDIIACSRILSPVQPDAKRLARLTARFLHANEVADLDRRFEHWRNIEAQTELDRRRIATWIAGRWAAKEAAKKAWGATLLSFKDLRVEADAQGRVQIVCDSGLQHPDRVTEQAGQLSISHDGDFAIATVLATPLHHDISADLGLRKAEAGAKVTI